LAVKINSGIEEELPHY